MAQKELLTSSWYSPKGIFNLFGITLLVSLFLAIGTNQYFLVGIPIALMIAFIGIVDFRKIFLLLFACIPISTDDIILPSGFSTDLPTEPLMIVLMGVFLLYVLRNGKRLNTDFLRHPITLLLLLHIGWTLVCTVNSASFFVSLKFFLAKLWYVITFYFLGGLLLKKEKDIRSLFWWVLIPLIAVILITLIRHSATGFSFKEVNFILAPFYSNHVVYACIITIFMPFVWFARQWYPRWSLKWWFLLGCIPFMLVAIQLSFTRAAYVGILLAVGAYFVIRLRQIKLVIAIASIVLIAGVAHVVTDNKYLDYAPEFEKTISHENFDNLLEATTKGQDVSTMERVYRWVAGFQMISERPVFGFGPGNFYFFYKTYTVTSFKTYVSDNPEKSGIHSYYLMLFVEQGYFGGLLFLLFSFLILIKGENIYHHSPTEARRRLVMIAMLCIIIIDALLIINDLIEADKVGPFYFISIVMLVNADLANQREVKMEKLET